MRFIESIIVTEHLESRMFKLLTITQYRITAFVVFESMYKLYNPVTIRKPLVISFIFNKKGLISIVVRCVSLLCKECYQLGSIRCQINLVYVILCRRDVRTKSHDLTCWSLQNKILTFEISFKTLLIFNTAQSYSTLAVREFC